MQLVSATEWVSWAIRRSGLLTSQPFLPAPSSVKSKQSTGLRQGSWVRLGCGGADLLGATVVAVDLYFAIPCNATVRIRSGCADPLAMGAVGGGFAVRLWCWLLVQVLR
ncbi:unnamed protein product [Fraxinus pennsylvanica]|uniref:Uncharacterized protein n=1 Tax=Fraxinus pennsylvanica TaxID=56036 RepID=A0AAD2DL44_9LAMI|nr:unnamed protein product [Fraxinus pennsylvanica]